MTSIMLLCMALAAPPQGSASPTKDEADKPAALAPIAWADRVTQALRAEATTKDEEHLNATRDLLGLYLELNAIDPKQDPRLSEEDHRQLLRKLAQRLSKVADTLDKKNQAGNQDSAKIAGKGPSAPHSKNSPSEALPEVEIASNENKAASAEQKLRKEIADILAQQLNQFGQGAAGRSPHADLLELIKTTIRPDSWDDRGGPGRGMLFPPLGAIRAMQKGVEKFEDYMPRIGYDVEGMLASAFGGAADDGELLVDLIRSTIAPQSWDTVGGPGSIYYFRGLRVLVIRQSDEIHENLGGVLDQLRRN